MAQTTWLPIPHVMDGQHFRIYPLTTFIQNTPAAFQIELIGCELPSEQVKNPMAFATMKCTGLEERMEDCNVTASQPNDKFCNLDTAVRPKCKVHCGDPGLKACSTRSGLNFFHPHMVNFTCLNGNIQNMKCEANGFWSSPGNQPANAIQSSKYKEIPTSKFQLPIFNFQLPTSNFQFPTFFMSNEFQFHFAIYRTPFPQKLNSIFGQFQFHILLDFNSNSNSNC
jgi:hypothetical protein